MIRNLYHFQELFPNAATQGIVKHALTEPLKKSILDYLTSQPVFDNLFSSFYGVIGWIGTGGGKVQVCIANGFPSAIFTCGVIIITFSILYSLFNDTYSEEGEIKFTVAILILSLIIFINIPKGSSQIKNIKNF